MGILEAATYFDMSGHQASDSPLVMVGLFSPEQKWLAFERRWQTEVLGAGRIPYVHMKEFAPMIGPFLFLREDEPLRRAIIQAMIKVIKAGANKIIAYYLSPATFREMDRLYDFAGFWHGAFSLAAVGCTSWFRHWIHEHHPKARVKYVYEAGDQGWGRFQELTKAVHIEPIPHPKIDPDTGEWFAPFQAADFIGWELARELHEQDPPLRRRKPRQSLKELTKQLPQLELREFQLSSALSLAGQYAEMFPSRAIRS